MSIATCEFDSHPAHRETSTYGLVSFFHPLTRKTINRPGGLWETCTSGAVEYRGNFGSVNKAKCHSGPCVMGKVVRRNSDCEWARSEPVPNGGLLQVISGTGFCFGLNENRYICLSLYLSNNGV